MDAKLGTEASAGEQKNGAVVPGGTASVEMSAVGSVSASTSELGVGLSSPSASVTVSDAAATAISEELKANEKAEDQKRQEANLARLNNYLEVVSNPDSMRRFINTPCDRAQVMLKLFNYYLQAATVIFALNSVIDDDSYHSNSVFTSLAIAFIPWFLTSWFRFYFMNRIHDLSDDAFFQVLPTVSRVAADTMIFGGIFSVTQMVDQLNLYKHLSSSAVGFICAGLITVVHAITEIRVTMQIRNLNDWSPYANFIDNLFTFTWSSAWKESYKHGFFKGVVESIETLVNVLALYALFPTPSHVSYLPIIAFLSWQLSNLISYFSFVESPWKRLVPDKVYREVSVRICEMTKADLSQEKALDQKADTILFRFGRNYALGNVGLSALAACGIAAITTLLNQYNCFDAQTSATSGSKQENIQNVSITLALYSSMIMLTNVLNVWWYRRMNNYDVNRLFQPARNAVAAAGPGGYALVPNDLAAAPSSAAASATATVGVTVAA